MGETSPLGETPGKLDRNSWNLHLWDGSPNFIAPPSDDDVGPVFSCCHLSSSRVRHHDRRLHHVHQCLHLYSQLSADQPSNYIWPSEPTGLLKLSAPYWNVRDRLQTAIFLIINLHSLTCLFSNPVSSFCKLLEQEKKMTTLELCLLFLCFKWSTHQKSKEHGGSVRWLLFAQRPRHCKLLVFAKGQPSFL